MKPYYQDESVTLYNCDCREMLPELKADSVITDPPYNCGKDYGKYKDNMTDPEYKNFMQDVTGLCLGAAANQFWVAPRYKLEMFLSLLPGSHLVVIRRGASGPFRQGWSDQFEIALAIGKPDKCVSDLWTGIRLKGEGYFFTEETYGHPGYTPLPIMSKAVLLLGGASIIDPFCGTGTTLVAAKSLGRKAVGIEISEEYCEICVKRLQQEYLKL